MLHVRYLIFTIANILHNVLYNVPQLIATEARRDDFGRGTAGAVS